MIITAGEGGWEDKRETEWPLSRTQEMLDENAPDELNNEISKRLALPTLFAYEDHRGKARTGKITRIKPGSTQYRRVLHWELDEGKPVIDLVKVEDYRIIGCTNESRSHWKVVPHDLYKLMFEYGEWEEKDMIEQTGANKRVWGERWREHRKVFISHKADAKGYAKELKRAVEQAGMAAFVAHEDIEPSALWQVEIEAALQSMTHFVGLITKGFHQSSWTNQEVGIAYWRKIPRMFIEIEIREPPQGLVAREQAAGGEWMGTRNRTVEWVTST